MSEHEPFEPEKSTSLSMLAKILGGASIVAAAGATAFVTKKIVEKQQGTTTTETGDADEDL